MDKKILDHYLEFGPFTNPGFYKELSKILLPNLGVNYHVSCYTQKSSRQNELS